MPISKNFRNVIDPPMWIGMSPSFVNSGAGTAMTFDPREKARSPYIYLLTGTTAFYAYNSVNDEWMQLPSPALAGTVAAGATMAFHAVGPSGSINATGATTTKFALSTALPAAVGVNSMANRGDGVGFYIRVIGKTSGKTENRRIIGNTGGTTTPTVLLDSPLSFTPVAGDLYEFQSGRVYILGSGTLATGSFKYWDILTSSFTTVAHAGLPASITTDSCMVALCEDFTPHNRAGNEGFLGTMTATATTSTTLTGMVSNTGATPPVGDAAVLANEYRNFQLRIVEDAGAPTAVGQRRRITSHTAGTPGVTAPVYTVATWTVTPSATAKYVLENDDDKILLWTTAATTTYNYNITANTWDTTTWAARGVAVGAGCFGDQSYGLVPDAEKNARHSFIFSFRGANTAAIDVLDIAGAATGAWTNDIPYGNKGGVLFNAGSDGAYDGNSRGGRLMYINVTGTQRFVIFDLKNRVMQPMTFLPTTQGTVGASSRMALALYSDNAEIATSEKVTFVYHLNMTGQHWHRLMTQDSSDARVEQ